MCYTLYIQITTDIIKLQGLVHFRLVTAAVRTSGMTYRELDQDTSGYYLYFVFPVPAGSRSSYGNGFERDNEFAGDWLVR